MPPQLSSNAHQSPRLASVFGEQVFWTKIWLYITRKSYHFSCLDIKLYVSVVGGCRGLPAMKKA